jgi:hypothetical protein
VATQIMYTLPGDTALDILDVDATLQFTETRTSQATDHPVETGGVISDHIIKRPLTLKLDGIVTDTPLGQTLLDTGTPLEAISTGQAQDQAKAYAQARAADPISNQAKDILRTLHDAKVQITLATGTTRGSNGGAEQVFESMVIEQLEFPRDEKTGDAVRFTLSLKEIITVESQTVPLANTLKPGLKDTGRQGTTALEGKPKETASPLLRLVSPEKAAAWGYKPLLGGILGGGP